MTSEFAQLEGKTAVVTGSSSGIGRAIALEFARAGAQVLIHYAKSKTKAEETAALIRQQTGRQTPVIGCDFVDSERFEEFVNSCWNLFPELDIWVNNAGVDLLTGEARSFSAEVKLQHLLQIDVTSTVLLSKLAGQHMKQQGKGTILNIGWDQADRGMEGDSGELFAASKNSIMGFSRSLAVSLAPAVRVNCIAPGWIKTAWGETASEEWQNRVLTETPLQRWGLPEDIAKAARFLVSDEANFITGQVINVNGGAVR